MELIDKAVLIAEVERKIQEIQERWKLRNGLITATGQGALGGYNSILSFLNSPDSDHLKKADSLKVYKVNVCAYERVRPWFVIAHSVCEAKSLILNDPLYKQYEIDVVIEGITEVADFATATPKVL